MKRRGYAHSFKEENILVLHLNLRYTNNHSGYDNMIEIFILKI